MKKYHNGRIIHLSFSQKNTEAYTNDVLNFMRCSVSEDKDLEQANRLDAFFFFSPSISGLNFLVFVQSF